MTISQAQGLSPQYDQATLNEHVVQLYCAILDMLRHIIQTYSRVVVNDNHVHFKERTKDYELLRRCQRLIILEQQVVLDQHVRLEALNSLKSMGDEQWSVIFAGELPRQDCCSFGLLKTVLNEQLVEIQDDQELEELEEERDTSESDETTYILGTDICA